MENLKIANEKTKENLSRDISMNSQGPLEMRPLPKTQHRAEKSKSHPKQSAWEHQKKLKWQFESIVQSNNLF